jgi:hypothetical protein
VIALRNKAITPQQTVSDAVTGIVPWVLPDALRVCAAHIGPLLICGVIAFAGAAILGSVVFSGLTLDAYLRSEGFFTAIQRNTIWQYAARAACGALLFTLGRGAITWIALNAEQPALSARTALRHAAARWPALLTSMFIYGALITIATLGLSIVLRELRLDLSNFRWLRSNDGESLTRALAVNALALLPPDPGAPFAELLAAGRFALGRDSGVISSGWRTPRIPEALSTGMSALAALSIAIIVAVDGLLALRTAAAMNTLSHSPLAWLADTVRTGIRRPVWLLTHRWLFRLLIALVLTLGVTLPTLLQQGLLLPTIARETRSYWPYAFSITLQGLSATLVALLFGVVQTVYDARLFAHLSEK